MDPVLGMDLVLGIFLLADLHFLSEEDERKHQRRRHVRSRRAIALAQAFDQVIDIFSLSQPLQM